MTDNTANNKSGRVQIGREFFAKIKNDYSDWRWALVREFLQNCFDAPGCDEVRMLVERCEGNTLLTVYNNGEPMSEDVLFNKLLTLGGSGKNFEGEATGGFGVAKSLLYYTHLHYQIKTGALTVEGEGAQYESRIETDHRIDGTESQVWLEGDEVANLNYTVRRFASMAQWKGRLVLNGEDLVTDLKKGSRRKDLGWGVVYTNHSFANVCVVRLNGQPMFTRYTRFKGCVLIELTGKAVSTLTSNRDSLRGQYASELSDLLTAIAVDKRSALREQKAEYKRFMGEKLRNEAKKAKVVKDVSVGDLVDLSALTALLESQTGPKTEVTPDTATGGIRVVATGREDVTSVSVGYEFILKNTTGMVTPSYYTPGDDFSKYSKDLLRAWVAVLVKLYQIHEIDATFSVGFVFDEESEAECESGQYGLVYYLNPAKVVCQKSKPQCRSLRARYVGAWVNRFEIIAVAAHEFVHGAYGLTEHDEDFAGRYTDVMGTLMANLKDITPLFRA